MTLNRYTDVGFDGVLVDGPDMLREENGEEIFRVPAIGLLHQKIAEALVTRPFPLAGGELRFLRSEIGEDIDAFATTVGIASSILHAAERDGNSLDPECEARLRRLSVDRLELSVSADRLVFREPRPKDLPAIVIDAIGERAYAVRSFDVGSQASVTSPAPRILSPLDVARSGLRVLLDSLGPAPAARTPWETLRASLVWLSIPLDSLARPTSAAPVGYRRAPGANDRAGAAKIADAPEDLHWVPSDIRALSTGQISLTLAYTGSGTPTEPAIDLRHNGAPIEPAKINFNPTAKSITIRLPGLDEVVKVVDVAQGGEDRFLVVNIGG